MILKNLLSVGINYPLNIEIAGSEIRAVRASGAAEANDGPELKFDDALVFPGLINSHDHLDFNLFPALGDRTYHNYTEWGNHIHEHHQEEIAKVLKVPALFREQWGIYKNLMCGVTTVVNHGERLQLHNRLIDVYERYQCIHSLRFEKRWRQKLNNPFKLRDPVVVHTGEGTDDDAFREIGELIRWNLLRKMLIGVHGVAMSAMQAKRFRAVVWCPESNFFLLRQTAAIAALKKETAILFGTDSTLTGSWNIWEHLRLARKTGELTDTELYQSLGPLAAEVWGINTGKLAAGYKADLVVADIKGKQGNMEAFFSIDPKDILLVIQAGQIRLLDASCMSQLENEPAGFSKIDVNGVCKFVQGDIAGLMEKIKQYYPGAEFPVRGGIGHHDAAGAHFQH